MYNGWSNYDTWNVFNILSNDEGSYNAAISAESVQDIKSLAIGISYDTTPNWTEILEAFQACR